jgi:hypothetical protein
MKKILDKTDLLNPSNIRRELVDVPELGASLWMRQMSAVEVIEFKTHVDALKASGVTETTFEQDVDIMTLIISLSACDESGNLLLTQAEAKGLTANNINVLMFLGNKALEISKVNIGLYGFTGEATNTLPNAPKMSLSQNSPANYTRRKRKS